MKGFILAFAVIFAANIFAEGSAHTQSPAIIPWLLPLHHKEALNEDKHLHQVVINNDGTRLAFVGSYVWLWQPELGTMQKLSLPQSSPTQALVGAAWLDEQNLLMVATSSFAVMPIDPHLKATQVNLKSSSPAVLIGFQNKGAQLHFFTRQHLISFERDLNQRKIIDLSPLGLPENAQIATDDSAKELWWLSERTLYHAWNLGAKVEKKLLFRADENLLSLSTHGKFAALTTSKSTLIFGVDNELKQGIAVNSQRRIVAANTQQNKHIYLYRDGYLEVIDGVSGVRKSGRIALSPQERVSSIAAANDVIALVSNGVAQVWRFQDAGPTVSGKVEMKGKN